MGVSKKGIQQLVFTVLVPNSMVIYLDGKCMTAKLGKMHLQAVILRRLLKRDLSMLCHLERHSKIESIASVRKFFQSGERRHQNCGKNIRYTYQYLKNVFFVLMPCPDQCYQIQAGDKANGSKQYGIILKMRDPKNV